MYREHPLTRDWVHTSDEGGTPIVGTTDMKGLGLSPLRKLVSRCMDFTPDRLFTFRSTGNLVLNTSNLNTGCPWFQFGS